MDVPKRLGDPHNFGQYVKRLSPDLIHKPRCVFWEWLFLDQSPLRLFLEKMEVGGESIIASWPITTIDTYDNYKSGNIDSISVQSSGSVSQTEARQIGHTIALILWFGIGDLHVENIVTGRNEKGQFIFGPLDIESIFEDITLPSQTLLFPGKTISVERCGLGAIFQKLCDPILILELCRGVNGALTTLSRHENAIKVLLINLIEHYNPVIRKIVRSTDEYVSFKKDDTPTMTGNGPFHESEIEQMMRGDVPYYFRFPDSATLYHYTTPNRYVEIENFGHGPNYKGIQSIVVNTKQPALWPRPYSQIAKLPLLQIAKKLLSSNSAVDCSIAGDRLYCIDGKLVIKVGNIRVSTNVD